VSKEREMNRSLLVLRVLPPTLMALLGLACAGPPHLAPASEVGRSPLEAQGPGRVFGSIECAAVDALIYVHLQAQVTGDRGMRGGTIYATEGGYSYDEIITETPPRKGTTYTGLSYTLKPRDVARFHIYAESRLEIGTAAQVMTPSKLDLRSVRSVDPLHRPLYILYPSLVIRVYRGVDAESIEVADLGRTGRPARVARLCVPNIRPG
jgi:hypothetical protein